MPETMEFDLNRLTQDSGPESPANFAGQILPRNWETPGAALTKAVQDLDAVRFVFETLRSDGWGIVVVLSEDPEEVLDRIFSAEHDLYSAFPGARIDVRVTKATPDLDAKELARASTFCHLSRA